jgi:hypothetical protein
LEEGDFRLRGRLEKSFLGYLLRGSPSPIALEDTSQGCYIVSRVFEAFKYVFFNTIGQKKNKMNLSKERKEKNKNKRPLIIGISPEHYIFFG